MEEFIIRGKIPLAGSIEVRGSKNAASKLMIASLLTDEPCVIENIPLSGEIEITKEICESVGSMVALTPEHTCEISTSRIKSSVMPEFSRRNRIPILTLGPLLHRRGFAQVPVPGGDKIGHRPINFHIDALAQMGVQIERRENSYSAVAREIHGATVEFPFPSVGATENVLLAAVLARGRTIIQNAAVEPEIMNLIQMLVLMGASISADERKRIFKIEGVKRLKGARIRVMPDRNEIVSFACSALATGGEIFIPDIEENYILPFIATVRAIGGESEAKKNGIAFSGKLPYKPTQIEAGIYPGFMTDWQQPFSILLTQARGRSIIHETVYEDRLGYTNDLANMGARVSLSEECGNKDSCRFYGLGYKHVAFIDGPTLLSGSTINVRDIRAGMAHIIAALAAEGESRISGIEHIDRGYEKIDERLRALGADIERVRGFG